MQANPHRTDNTRTKRALWFVLLYVGSLAAFAALTYGLKSIIPH